MWKRLFEWYLALEPAGPHGTRWQWELPGFSTVGLSWAWLGAVAVVVIVLYGMELRHRRGVPAWGLPILRLIAVAISLLWLGQVTLVVARTGAPSLAILIDESGSMSLEDRYGDDATGARAQSLLRESGHTQPTRANIVKSLLRNEDGRILRELAGRYRLDLHAFSGSVRPIGSADGPTDVDDLLMAIDAIQADGAQSRPGPSVLDLLAGYHGAPPNAVVIVTDGVANDGGDRLSTVAANPGSVPLFAIGIGSDDPPRDVAIADLDTAPVAFVDDPIVIDARVHASGYEGRNVRITLRETGRAGTLAETVVPATEAGEAARLSYTPTTTGTMEFVVQAEPMEGESDVTNNQSAIRVQVRGEQLRVLLVERAPRWEFRHLKGVLERDPTVIVQTVLQESDAGYDVDDRTAIPVFPVSQAELDAFDVLILGDVDLSYLHPGALEAVCKFVGDRGGGLILIAGDRHNPSSLAATPLEELLPVEWEEGGPVIEASPRDGFLIEPTRQGRAMPMFQLADRGDVSDDVWPDLPGLHWAYRVRPKRPGALVLAGHATRHTADGPLPIVVMQRYGAGQVVFHATDELWRWRKGVEDLFYGRYWRSLVRYLSRPESLAAAGVELTSDRRVYGVGDPIRIQARFTDPSSLADQAAGVSVVTERTGAAPRTLTLAPTDIAGVYEAVQPADAIGDFQSWLVSPVIGEDPPSMSFRVEAPQSELRHRRPDHTDLALAAKLSRGAFYEIDDVDRVVAELPRESRTAAVSADRVLIWRRWELFVLFTAALAAEWLLRKRLRLI